MANLGILLYHPLENFNLLFNFRATLEGNANKSVIINMPFLPVNPDYGTTRNQGRQKLARLESREFNTLVIDVLKEIRRRQTEMTGGWHPTAASSTTTTKMPSPLRETGSSFLRDATKMGLTKSLPMPRLIFFFVPPLFCSNLLKSWDFLIFFFLIQ